VDWDAPGTFGSSGAAGIILDRADMNLAQELARREKMTVSEYISKTLRKELLAVS